MRVQQELDETKIILVGFIQLKDCVYVLIADMTQHKTIDSVLQRGENLEILVNKTTLLSTQSKAFYKTAKKVCSPLRFNSSSVLCYYFTFSNGN